MATKKQQLNIAFPPAKLAHIKQLAKRHEVSAAEFVRRLVDIGLQQLKEIRR